MRFGVRSAIRSATAVSRRMYAEETVKSDAVMLTFACPHNTLVYKKPMKQITVPGDGGEFGILANHVPITSQLSPGVVILEPVKVSGGEDAAQANALPTHYFVSGGYVTVFDDSSAAITCPEAVPLHHLSLEHVRDTLSKVTQDEKGSADPEHRKNATVAIQVYKAMLDAIEKYKAIYDEGSAKLQQ